MRVLNLGLVPYEQGLLIQDEAVRKLEKDGTQTTILLEHPPVITLGRNGGEENLPLPRPFFEERGISIIKSTRGGNITCHFPGQLVVYPIMRIDRHPGGLKRFFHDMEESVIRLLAQYKITSTRIDGRAGVWVGGKKICSTGIAVKRWITSHGLSLNVERDLSLFNTITPCGLTGVQATSVHRELDKTEPSMEEIKNQFIQHFSDTFNLHPIM